MKLFLHIGTEKTGTTSVQGWFARNRDALAAQGVVYSRVLGPQTHRRLCLWCLDEDRKDDGFRNNGIEGAAARTAFRDALPGQFAEEVEAARAAGARAFVISNEHLQSRLKTPREVARVQDFLAPHFDEIEVICVLRPQVEVAVSLASTISRDRFRLTDRFFERVNPDNPYYNFARLEWRWSAAFGAGAVRLCPFRSRPDLVADLVAELGIDTAGFETPERRNQALDVRVMAMMNAVRVPLVEDGRRNPFGTLFLDELPFGERLEIGRDTARAIQARFAESNAKLAARRDDITLEDLEPDWTRFAEAANTGLLDQDCAFADQVAALVRVFNERLRLEELRTRMAETERALARGNLGSAERLLEKCRHEAGVLARAQAFGGEIAAACGRVEDIAAQLAARRERQAGNEA